MTLFRMVVLAVCAAVPRHFVRRVGVAWSETARNGDPALAPCQWDRSREISLTFEATWGHRCGLCRPFDEWCAQSRLLPARGEPRCAKPKRISVKRAKGKKGNKAQGRDYIRCDGKEKTRQSSQTVNPHSMHAHSAEASRHHVLGATSLPSPPTPLALPRCPTGRIRGGRRCGGSPRRASEARLDRRVLGMRVLLLRPWVRLAPGGADLLAQVGGDRVCRGHGCCCYFLRQTGERRNVSEFASGS